METIAAWVHTVVTLGWHVYKAIHALPMINSNRSVVIVYSENNSKHKKENLHVRFPRERSAPRRLSWTHCGVSKEDCQLGTKLCLESQPRVRKGRSRLNAEKCVTLLRRVGDPILGKQFRSPRKINSVPELTTRSLYPIWGHFPSSPKGHWKELLLWNKRCPPGLLSASLCTHVPLPTWGIHKAAEDSLILPLSAWLFLITWLAEEEDWVLRSLL